MGMRWPSSAGSWPTHLDSKARSPTSIRRTRTPRRPTSNGSGFRGCSPSWRAERPTRVATIAAGYADGFLRATPSDNADARPPRLIEIGGRAAPVVGRVTMDMTMIAVEDASVRIGDVATLYGGLVSLDQQA